MTSSYVHFMSFYGLDMARMCPSYGPDVFRSHQGVIESAREVMDTERKASTESARFNTMEVAARRWETAAPLRLGRATGIEGGPIGQFRR